MRIDADTRIWLVSDSRSDPAMPCCRYSTTLAGLRSYFRAGLDMDANPTVFTSEEEANKEAARRDIVGRIARQIETSGALRKHEVVRLVLHGEDGRVLYEGEVR